MKKLIFLFAAVIFSTMAFAQDDFSGSWKLNTSKSKLGDQFSMAPKEIIIVQNGIDMSVERHTEFQGQEFTINDKFTLDGKECLNDGWQGSKKKSTAVWSDDKKSLKITTKLPMQDEEMTVVAVYKMEGENMVIESTASSSYGDLSETQVFDKK